MTSRRKCSRHVRRTWRRMELITYRNCTSVHTLLPQKGLVWQWSSEQGKVSQIKLGKRSRGHIMKDSLGLVKDFETIYIRGRMITIPKVSSFSIWGCYLICVITALFYRPVSFFVYQTWLGICLESSQYFSVILCAIFLFFFLPSLFQGIIDYIFYSKPQLNTLGILGPLDHHWLVENNISGCPHPLIPSDHFSLFAQLELLLPFLPQVNGIHLPGRR